MKILLINFCGSLLVILTQEPGALSRRLAALRAWPSERNRLPPQ